MAAGIAQWWNNDAGEKRITHFLGALIVWVGATVGIDAFAYDLELIEVNALATQEGQWVILDARPQSAWRTAHLPGAQSFSWEDYTRTDAQKIAYRIWPAAELADALGRMGIDAQTKVVAYGDADTSWGGEGWVCWALIWLGHQGPIRMLDGGVQAWQQAGLAMDVDNEGHRYRKTEYRIQLRAEVNITAPDVATPFENRILVDTRSTLEWFTGHLPAAVHLPWKSLFHGEDRRPVDADTYRSQLRECGIKASDELVFYCTGGIRSAYAWMIHQLYETSPARNFEGGTEAWKSLPAR